VSPALYATHDVLRVTTPGAAPKSADPLTNDSLQSPSGYVMDRDTVCAPEASITDVLTVHASVPSRAHSWQYVEATLACAAAASRPCAMKKRSRPSDVLRIHAPEKSVLLAWRHATRIPGSAPRHVGLGGSRDTATRP
jgi:hypothetical protein